MSPVEQQDEVLQQEALPSPEITFKAASPYFSFTIFFTSMVVSSFNTDHSARLFRRPDKDSGFTAPVRVQHSA
jgi:hypothetical protein